MARTIVIGTGRLGQAVVRAVRARGGDAIAVGRKDGVDVTGPIDLRPFVGDQGVAAVVEATSAASNKTDEVVEFFGKSARNVAAGAAAINAGRHILVSIVGCDLAAGSPHYAGKVAQERAARAAATPQTPLVIVRSTQWFEFARQITDMLRRGPVALVPRMRIQPVALDAVADVVAQIAVGQRPPVDVNVSGPQRTTLRALVRQLADRPPITVPIPMVGAARAAWGGALIPAAGAAEVVGETFVSWLSKHPDGRRRDLAQ